ncbi:BQ5605_C032g11058 [Microbotryum silenes-dioicae]|uniref:BQ5605_C032g11058 protein n=1 Tax=Microbotryum silenes-dioicae TaxID=796604 RepID=A0A2X0PHK2_9BASI|nr:BQ5605_C032g11058 [Microbotryum silenes-dioicae]
MGKLESHSPFCDMDNKPNLANFEHEAPAGLSAFSSLLQRFLHPTAAGSRDRRDWMSKVPPASALPPRPRSLAMREPAAASPVASTSSSNIIVPIKASVTPARSQSRRPRRSSRSSTSRSQPAITSPSTRPSTTTSLRPGPRASLLSSPHFESSPSDPSSESSLSDVDGENDICYGSTDDDNFALSSRTSSRLVNKHKKRKRSASSKPALPPSCGLEGRLWWMYQHSVVSAAPACGVGVPIRSHVQALW